MKRIDLVLAALIAACHPGVATSDVSVIQDSCAVGVDFPVVFFSIENHDSSMPVCTVTLSANDYSSCFLVGCGAPSGWTCFPGDESTFFAAEPAPGECIPAGATTHGFNAKLYADTCCFLISFQGSDSSMIGMQRLCFQCPNVGIEPAGWGDVKSLFQ